MPPFPSAPAGSAGGHPVAWHGCRTLVIGDVPYVHQLLEVYVSKLVRPGPPPQGRPSGVLRYSILACLNPASGASC